MIDSNQSIKYKTKNDNTWNKCQFISLRPSQIACTVTTMHVTCMQTTLHVDENFCTLLIPISKNNLNMPMCSFFVLCLVASSSCSLCYHACYLPALHGFFCLFIFTEDNFVAQL